MRYLRPLFGILIVALFVGGSTFIIANGRPVAQLGNQPTIPTAQRNPPTTPTVTQKNPTQGAGWFSGDSEEDDGGGLPTPTPSITSPTTTPTEPATTPTSTQGTYAMADVATHATSTDCWSVIDGGVYDLTSWIDRHPGGPDFIIGLCGIDGTASYHGQHGNFSRPAAFLALLKIGTLR